MIPRAPVVSYADATLCISSWRNLHLMDIRTAVDLAAMARMEQLSQQIQKTYPNGSVSMTLLRQGTGMPPKEVRAEGSRLMKAHRAARIKSVVVIEEGGIMASLMQTVLRGLNVITGEQRLQIFTGLDPAARTVAAMVSAEAGLVTGADILSVIAAARTAYASRLGTP